MPLDGLILRTWSRDAYILSTDPALVPIEQLIEAFNSKEFYWANALSEANMACMINNSMIFAIYEHSTQEPRSLIGFARLVTDLTTFAYLTDVWVAAPHQGRGLGAWMITCINEVIESLPHLRRTLLFTGDWQRSVPFYRKLMAMDLLDTKPGEGLAIMEKKGRGHPSYGRAGSSYT